MMTETTLTRMSIYYLVMIFYGECSQSFLPFYILNYPNQIGPIGLMQVAPNLIYIVLGKNPCEPICLYIIYCVITNFKNYIYIYIKPCKHTYLYIIYYFIRNFKNYIIRYIILFLIEYKKIKLMF